MTDQIDVLEMSSEEFENYDFDSLFEGSDMESSDVESNEPLEEVDQGVEGGEPTDLSAAESEYSDEESVELTDGESSEEVDATQEPRFSIDLDGSKIDLNSDDEVKQYIEASSKHYKDAQAYNQSKDLIRALKENGIDESQLSFAIDLLKKDPKAINALVKDLDLIEILDDEAEYTPKAITPPPAVRRMDEVLESISHTPAYQRTVETVGKVWDETSLQQFRDNPEWLITLNDHMSSGVFDLVNAEVKKRQMMGQIPRGMSDYQVYDMVGESMYAQQQQAPTQQAPIRKPSRDTNIRQKQSMSTPRSKPSVSHEPEDVLSMSSEEFEAYKRKHPKLFY